MVTLVKNVHEVEMLEIAQQERIAKFEGLFLTF